MGLGHAVTYQLDVLLDTSSSLARSLAPGVNPAWGVVPRKDPNIEDKSDRVSNEGSVENNALWRGLDSEESRLPHTVTSLTLTGSNRRIEANLESQIYPTVPFGSEMRSPSTIAMTRHRH